MAMLNNRRVIAMGKFVETMSLLVAEINTVVLSEGKSHAELFAFHGVCDNTA